jgi:glycosyltransferase involved in cell wall biosynthesis
MLLAVLPRLARMGIEPVVVYGSESAGEGQLLPKGVPAIHLPALQRALRPGADAAAFSALVRLLRRLRPDVVHTRLAKAGALGRVAARAAGVPAVVHTFHGHVLDRVFPRSAERALVITERLLARTTDALVAVSEQAQDELLRLGIGRPEQWRVIRQGYELAPLAASDLAPAVARRRLGLGPDGPLVGIVARLVAVKDHDAFLAAAVEVARAEPRAEFVIAGDGPERDRLEAEARALLGDRVSFLGWVTSLEALYRSLDVIVLTTSRNYEGTPAALIEAGAAGVAAVACAAGGVAEVVSDGQTGYLVPPGAVRLLAGRILELLRSPSLRARLGERARAFLVARYSADVSAAAHSKLYQEIAR